MPLKTSDFDYELPLEFIAQTPAEPRDSSRLLVLDRQSVALAHRRFSQVEEYLTPGDVLVINQTRVIPARLLGRKLPGGGRIELLLVKKQSESTWEVLAGGKGLKAGRQVQLDHGPLAEVIDVLDGPRRLVRFDQPVEPFLPLTGHVPLPPYITAPLHDPERYQTVYASQSGSVAAPTAGLHFTPALLERLQERGVQLASVTLHIGLDTFAPVHEDDPREHKIHTEFCQLDQAAADLINQAHHQGGKIIAVGTTSVRTLETAARAAQPGQRVAPVYGPTDLYILPGFHFKAVDRMITNFHLPRSTLLMLVSTFAGRETVLAAYEVAKQHGYRFYSFGDAMLIL